MKTKIRKWIGINEDKKEIYDTFKEMAEAIDKIFDLKKQDKSVLGIMNLIRIIKWNKDKR